MLLTFFWLFLLLIRRAEVKDYSTIEGCLNKHTDVRYRAISEKRFVLSCDLPLENPASIFNNSHHEWFWQPSKGGAVKYLGHEPTLWFSSVRVGNSGTYICRNGKKCVNISLHVQTKEMVNCSYDSTKNLMVGKGGEIDCPGKECFNHVSLAPPFTSSPSVTWYKNGEPVILDEKRSGLRLEHDRIVLETVYDKDNGTYICDYMQIDNSTRWLIIRTVISVNIIAKDTRRPPTILDPHNGNTLEAELGKPLKLKCKVQFSFERIASSSVHWYKKTSKQKKLLKENRVSPPGLDDWTHDHVFELKEVTEEDLSSHFICLAQNSVGNSTVVLKLTRKPGKDLRFWLTLCCSIILLLGLFLGVMLVYQHWIEIVLLYRNYKARDETLGDSKEFDAFVSYAKPYSPKADPTFLTEEQFALEVLPPFLEDKYGYKLCLPERDILPGGAYTDDIVNAVKKSRRAIMILSPRYVNGQAIFELEAAVNASLEDKTIKLILIEFEAFREPQSLPHKVKKALKVLPRVTWKTPASSAANKQFWKKLRYRMPVKCTNGTEAWQPSLVTPLVADCEKPLQEKAELINKEMFGKEIP